MLQRRISTCLSLAAAAAFGATASYGALWDLERLPAPAPAVVHVEGPHWAPVEGPHLAHGGCCVETCGHCSPDAHHKYRVSARRALKCEGSVEVCMHVVNPGCCGCPVEIPMCLPSCCVGEPPVVKSDRGLLGRGIVCFEWPCCGYSARVVFKHSGHIDVVYTAK